MALALAISSTGDLDLSGGGPRLVKGVDAAAGALVYRFTTFAGTGQVDRGEWAYDYAYGMTWRSAVLGRYFDEGPTRALLADVASRTTGVGPTSADQVTITTEPVTRTATITIDRIRIGNSVSAEPVTISVPIGALL